MFSVRVILWTIAMAYTGFLLTGQGLRTFNSLNYRSIPRSFNRIFPCYHVHSPRESATKACLSCIFNCTNFSELGHIPRTPRLTSEAKALIQTGRLSPG